MDNRKILLLALTILATGWLPAQDLDEYLVVKQDEKITLYERWVLFPGTTVMARQIKAVFYASTSLDKMLNTLSAEEKIKEWQKNLVEQRHFPKNDSTWHTYSLYDIPWPLTNQDYLLRYSITERTGARIVLAFQYSLNEKLAPLRKDVDRKPTIGEWVLEKTYGNQIKVTYTVTSIPVSFPRFITDTIVRNNFMHILNKLITVAEK